MLNYQRVYSTWICFHHHSQWFPRQGNGALQRRQEFREPSAASDLFIQLPTHQSITKQIEYLLFQTHAFQRGISAVIAGHSALRCAKSVTANLSDQMETIINYPIIQFHINYPIIYVYIIYLVSINYPIPSIWDRGIDGFDFPKSLWSGHAARWHVGYLDASWR